MNPALSRSNGRLTNPFLCVGFSFGCSFDVIAQFFAAEAAKEAATTIIDLLKLPKAASAEVDLLNLPKTVRLRYSIHLLFKKFNVFSFENNDAKRWMWNRERNDCREENHF